jgi:hypothetical protein
VGGWVFGKKVSLRTTSQLRWDVVKKTYQRLKRPETFFWFPTGFPWVSIRPRKINHDHDDQS